MVLTKDELLRALRSEVKILLHLSSKIEPSMLDYRPTPEQRSTLELLQYLTILGPVHTQAVLADSFVMADWRRAWTDGKAAAAALDFTGALAAIENLPAYFDAALAAFTDSDLRAEIEMFGHKASRGAMLVNLVLSHYTGYRMQLFLYLKASGRPELSTINLWAGVDRP